jgi:hypothetical protein
MRKVALASQKATVLWGFLGELNSDLAERIHSPDENLSNFKCLLGPFGVSIV